MELEVVAGTYDCMIRGFSIDALAPVEKGLRSKFHERDHTGSVRTVACGGHYLASGSSDEAIKVYDMTKHVEIGSLLQHEGSITWMTFYKDTHLLSASEDHTICVWKCGSWDCLHVLAGHKRAVTCVSVHPSGKLALSVGKDRTVRTWNLLTGSGAFTQRLPQVAELVTWSPIGDQYILVFEKSITIYDVKSGTPINSIDIGKHTNCLLYIQDTVVAVGSEHHFIQLFSTSTGECLMRLEGHTNRNYCSARNDSLTTDKFLPKLNLHSGVKGLALSPGGELLFSASSDGSIRAWRLREPLSDSTCIASVDTGARLTCLTVVCPENLLRELKQPQPPADKEDTSPKKSKKKRSNSDLQEASSDCVREGPSQGKKKRSNSDLQEASSDCVREGPSQGKKKRSNSDLQEASSDCVREGPSQGKKKRSNSDLQEASDCVREGPSQGKKKRSNSDLQEASSDCVHEGPSQGKKKRSNSDLQEASSDCVHEGPSQGKKKRVKHSSREDTVRTRPVARKLKRTGGVGKEPGRRRGKMKE